MLLSIGVYAITAQQPIVVPADVPAGGSGYPVYGEFVRPPSVGEILDVAMADIYEAATEEGVPKETKKAFVNVVKPFTKSKKVVPDVDSIDWAALERDALKVEMLLTLWQQLLDDEELILMAYIHYYH